MRIITETNHPHAEPNTKQTNYFGRRTKTTEADSAQRSYKGFVWATYSFMGFFNRRCGKLVFLPCVQENFPVDHPRPIGRRIWRFTWPSSFFGLE